MSNEKVAVIGVGNVGGALGRRLAHSGCEVVFGVRPGKQLDELLESCEGRATTASPAEAAARAGVIFLAVPAKVAVDVARSLGDLSGKVLVDCNNPLVWEQGPVWRPPPEGSLAAAIATAVAGAEVVKGFNTFGAEFHADPELGDHRVDVQLAGDSAEAKARVSAIAEAAGFVPIDAGPLRNAAVLENLAILWIHLATVGGHGRQVAFKLLPRRGDAA